MEDDLVLYRPPVVLCSGFGFQLNLQRSVSPKNAADLSFSGSMQLLLLSAALGERRSDDHLGGRGPII